MPQADEDLPMLSQKVVEQCSADFGGSNKKKFW
jgi:hypothetical protein